RYSEFVSVHPYAIFGPPEPSGTSEGLQATVDLLQRHGVANPRLWVTETGFSAWPSGVFAVPTQHLAADYQVRMHVMILSHPNVDALFVHSMRDTPDRGAAEAQFM